MVAWDPVAEAACYEILYRETDQPEWQVLGTVSAADAQQGGSFQYPLSKDNYFFAVRAVSSAGHASLPAVAR